jgi:hypothetical protein
MSEHIRAEKRNGRGVANFKEEIGTIDDVMFLPSLLESELVTRVLQPDL